MRSAIWLATALLVTAGGAACTTTPITKSAPVTEIEAERVTFASLDQDLTGGAPTRIEALLFRPVGPGPFPAVVALHGCGGLRQKGKLTPRHRAWAERLRDQGFVVFLPDSFTPRGQSSICRQKDRDIHPGVERSRDVYGALRFLQSQPFVLPDRVGLLGWSNGGSTVLASVGAEARSRPAELKHDYRVAIAFYPGCRVYLEKVSWNPVVPLSIFIGGADDWTPAEPCVLLGERARALGHQLDVTVYPGAYHDFDAPDLPVHVLRGIATTQSGTATTGTNPAAREASMARASELLRRALAGL